MCIPYFTKMLFGTSFPPTLPNKFSWFRINWRCIQKCFFLKCTHTQLFPQLFFSPHPTPHLSKLSRHFFFLSRNSLKTFRSISASIFVKRSWRNNDLCMFDVTLSSSSLFEVIYIIEPNTDTVDLLLWFYSSLLFDDVCYCPAFSASPITATAPLRSSRSQQG